VGPPLDPYARYIGPIMLAERMWNHGPAMQAWQAASGVPIPSFQGREMADIHAYVRRSSTLGAGCHAPEGGTRVGPDLARSATVKTPLGLATAMWNHAPAMFDVTQSRKVDWPRFERDEMRDLSAYLHALARRPP
jgi:hypothetical protein